MAMATKHYSPQIRRDLVTLLYHEAKRQRKPMTRLVDELLAAALRPTIPLRVPLVAQNT
jgi:hypothetical protein